MVNVELCEYESVTVTLTAPAEPAGVVTVMFVELLTVTLVPAVAPNVTVSPLTKLVPVMVTTVPPIIVPLVGDKLVMVGGAGDEAGN